MERKEEEDVSFLTPRRWDGADKVGHFRGQHAIWCCSVPTYRHGSADVGHKELAQVCQPPQALHVPETDPACDASSYSIFRIGVCAASIGGMVLASPP